jgi:hypothetical protein
LVAQGSATGIASPHLDNVWRRSAEEGTLSGDRLMIVHRTASAAFTATFESEQEVRDEHRVNLSFGALRLPTAEAVPLHTTLLVTLRGPWGGEAFVQAKVVAALPDGIALAVEGDAAAMLTRLLARLASESDAQAAPMPELEPQASEPHGSDAQENEPQESDSRERTQSSWDRVREQSQMQKILLAVKADRPDRAVLIQDNDPRVLLSVLRNPRLTVDEVVRIAKSSFLTYQIADVIGKAAQWMASLDVRVALVHNPKTPPAFSLRILPSLPVAELRTIARSGTNMALKQAALRKLQGS